MVFVARRKSLSRSYLGHYTGAFSRLLMIHRELTTSARRPGRDDSWTPTLLGFHKRELLREVLNIFGA